MSCWTDVRLRLHALWFHGRAERELGEEIGLHEEMARARGASTASFELAREECRDARGMRWLEDGLRDLGLAVRRLRGSRGFTVLALSTLALGIGANLALFTLVNAVLLRRLPVPHPEQLVLLGDPGMTGTASGTEDGAVNAPTYTQIEALRAENRSFTGLAAASGFELTMGVDWDGSRDAAVPIKLVSGNYFEVLGLTPRLGRLFGVAEAGNTPSRDAVLSYGYWQERFGGSRAAIGQVFRLRDTSFTVIGVAPRGFTGTTVGQAPAIYLPLAEVNTLLPGRDWLRDPPGITRLYWLLGIGRLRPGVTLAQARAQIAVIFARSVRAQAALAPDAITRADLLTQTLPVVRAARGANAAAGVYQNPLLLLQALAGCLLLIVVVNLGGMLLAQAAARRREFAMRIALGAGRGRLLRQLLTESLLLAVAGGALGWVLAAPLDQILLRMVHASHPHLALGLHPGATALMLVAGLVLLSTAGFGLAPALQLTRRDLARRVAKAQRTGAGPAWVAAQVALSLMLAAGAALFARSLAQLRAVPLGFQPAGLTEFNLNATLAGARGGQALTLYANVAAAVRRLPGVTAATYSENGLLTGRDSGDDVTLEGYGNGNVSSRLDSIAPGYFATLGVPLRRGRGFTAADRGRGMKPVIIDETMARLAFAGRDPLGQLATAHFTFGDQTYQIVGVAPHVQQQSPRQRASIPRMYFDIENRGAPVQDVTFELRTAPGSVLTRPQINRLVAAATGLPLQVNSFTTVSSLLEASLAPDRLLARLAGLLAALALGLCAMGLYALLSFTLARRRAEIGTRMALGAGRGQVTAMMVRRALTPLTAGIALGVAGSLGLGRFLASLLFQVRPTDPLSLATAALALLAVGLGAALIPALRASRIDPAQVLRAE